MTHCTGLMGKVCTCGLVHTPSGSTQSDEARRTAYQFAPGVIDGPDEPDPFPTCEGTQGWLGTAGFWAVALFAIFCAVMAALSFNH